MKKILSIFLVLCMCCGMITGCKKEMKVSADFNTETNQKEKVEECHYQIPAAWEKEGSTGDTTVFYYPDNGMLMVYYEEYEGGNLDDSLAQTYVRNFTSGWDKVEFGEMEPIDLSGVSAYSQEWKFEADGVSYVSKTILFNCGSGILNFTMNTEKDSDISYAEDFSEILNSISIYLPFESTLDDIYTMTMALKIDGTHEYISDGESQMDDGTFMQTYAEASSGSQIVLLADEQGKITLARAISNSAEELSEAAVVTISGMSVDTSTNSMSDVFMSLVPETIANMDIGYDKAVTKTADGVNYTIAREDTDKYTFEMRRDVATKSEYKMDEL